MFSLIIFGTDEENKPHECYRTGLRNCVSITENILGESGGIPVTCYVVAFKDGSTVTINDALYVSDIC